MTALKNRRQHLVMLLLASTIGSVSSDLALAGECDEFGKPGYVATRTVAFGNNKIVSKVFSLDGKEREETRIGDRTVIQIRSGPITVRFDEESNTGVRFRMLAKPSGKKNNPNVRTKKTKLADRQVVVIQRKVGNRWHQLIKVTCRLDGVLLAKEFPMVLPGAQPMQAKLQHSNIVLKEFSSVLFEVPKNVKIENR